MEICYQESDTLFEQQNALEAAFDVLFEEGGQKGDSFSTASHFTRIDSCVQLGVHYTYEVSYQRRSSNVLAGSCSHGRTLAYEWQSEGVQARQRENCFMANIKK